jgi:hypothetical protein
MGSMMDVGSKLQCRGARVAATAAKLAPPILVLSKPNVKIIFLCPFTDSFLFLEAIKAPCVPATNIKHLLNSKRQQQD